MANQITAMVKAAGGNDYISVHTVVGESGQGMSVIKKGATDTGNTGRAYAASILKSQQLTAWQSRGKNLRGGRNHPNPWRNRLR